MRRAALLAVLGLAIAPGAAGAVTYDQPLPMKSSIPADGARIDPQPTPVSWEIGGSFKNTEFPLFVEVSTQNVLGSDGTLDDANVIDSFGLYTILGSGNFTGQSVGGKGRWQDTPGTYYWQATAEVHEDPDNVFSPAHYYASRVLKIQVGGPPVVDTPAPTQPTPPAPQAPPVAQTAAKPATTVRVHSRALSHGHAKLLAGCAPAPCGLGVISIVKIGRKWYRGTPELTARTNSLTQHLYVPLPKATLRAIRAARKRHRAVKLYVEVDTIDTRSTIADRDFLVFAVSRVA
jgi:hypothetical protein